MLEVSPRIAGAMGLYRHLGVNFPLLSLYSHLGHPTQVNVVGAEIIMAKVYHNYIATDFSFSDIYVDLDDTILVDSKVNVDVLSMLYECRNRGKLVHLITRHSKNISETLRAFAISAELFDSITKVSSGSVSKSTFFPTDRKIVFMDDSFSERLGCPANVFTCDVDAACFVRGAARNPCFFSSKSVDKLRVSSEANTGMDDGFMIRNCLTHPNSSGVSVSAVDLKYFPPLRAFVKNFMLQTAKKYAEKGQLLLDIAPETHEGASPFKSYGVVIETLDVVPGADYCVDLTKDNSSTIPAGRFDLVVCTEVLEHTSQPFNSMKEINRVLKRGGLLFLSVPCNFRIHGPLPDSWRFTEWGVRQLCEQNGFEVVELTALESEDRTLFPLDYAAVCRKFS